MRQSPKAMCRSIKEAMTMKKLMLFSIAVLMISAAASATVVTGAGGGVYEKTAGKGPKFISDK